MLWGEASLLLPRGPPALPQPPLSPSTLPADFPKMQCPALWYLSTEGRSGQCGKVRSGPWSGGTTESRQCSGKRLQAPHEKHCCPITDSPCPRSRNPQEKGLVPLYRTVPHKTRQKDPLYLSMSSGFFLFLGCQEVLQAICPQGFPIYSQELWSSAWLTWIAGGKVRSAWVYLPHWKSLVGRA